MALVCVKCGCPLQSMEHGDISKLTKLSCEVSLTADKDDVKSSCGYAYQVFDPEKHFYTAQK